VSLYKIPIFERQRLRIGGVPIAVLTIWIALCLAATAIPAWPIPGLTGVITTAMLLSTLTPFILGPIAGAAFGAVYGLLIWILFPHTAFFGPLTILTNLGGSVVGGLAAANRNREVLLYYLGLAGLWFLHPMGRTGLMPLVLWQFLGPIIFAISGRIQFVVQQGLIHHGKELLFSILFIAWTKYMGNIFVGNILLLYLWGPAFPMELWVIGIPYYAIILIAVLIIAITFGGALLPILRKTRVQTFADFWRTRELDDSEGNESIESEEKYSS
jgi:hypothetical protein